MSAVGLPATAVAAFTDRVLADAQSAAPDLSGQIGRLRARTAEAPRILVTGSPGVGVSTLVGALAGGSSDERAAEPVLWCAADRPVPEDVPVGVRVRQVAGAALQNLTIIDDAGACNDVEWDSAAEAVVYLVDREPSVADREKIRQLGFGPAGTVLVVSRADEFGAGSLGSADPVADARGYARTLSEDTTSWATSVAVSPLLAAAASSPSVTGDAGLADRLASYRSPAVAAGLLGADIPPALMADLRSVGTYGVLHGGVGADDPARLLAEVSGIDDLRTVLIGRLSQAALLRRSAQILDEVGQLRFAASDPSAVSDVIERAWAAPAAWRIRLFPEIARLAQAGMDDDAALVARVADADSQADLAGVTAGSPQVEILNGLREQLRTVNLRLTGFTVPVVEAALTAVSVVLRRAIGDVETALGGSNYSTGVGLWES